MWANQLLLIPSNKLHHQGSLEKTKRATVGPLPGVTRDIAGFKIAHQPSIYVLDTPGVLIPSIPDLETGLKLALTGAVKDSVVGEDRLAQYLLAILNTRSTPLHWKHLRHRRVERCLEEQQDQDQEHNLQASLSRRRKLLNDSDVHYIEGVVAEVQRALYLTYSEFEGNLDDESDLRSLIDEQFAALQKAFKISVHKTGEEARMMVSKKFLTLFRIGKLGQFTLDEVPDSI